ncbi:MAG TPA: protein phosphatase 2C domain-containing protein, partial [Pseudohaliea sp.]|nr:protein phosphatase 2C domain-containing protein [Pseudohaliea sp.]
DHPRCTGLGATVVLLAAGRDEVALAHAGDARAYRLRAGTLEPLTRDHNLAGEAVARGWLSAEDARHAPERHQITRALGLDEALGGEVRRLRRQPGDLLLLCSDGLSGELPDSDLQDLLQDSGPDLETTARRLVHAALESGGSDNITVVLVRL